MAYLDSRTILIDAVLTPRGKELLNQGALNITKFALFDDEIDYGLFNAQSLYGISDVEILKLPVLEPTPNYVPKYFLSDVEPRVNQLIKETI
jgi:hypothetical protein